MTSKKKKNEPKGIIRELRIDPGGTLLTGDPHEKPKIVVINQDEVSAELVRRITDGIVRHGGKLSDLGPATIKLLLEVDPSLQLIDVMPPGRKKEWNIIKFFFLWWDVEILRRGGVSVVSACKELGKRDDWRSIAPQSLRAAYNDASVSPFVMLVKNLEKEVGWESVLALFDSFVKPENRLDFLGSSEEIQKKPVV